MENEPQIFDAFKERMVKITENNKKMAWERIFSVLQQIELIDLETNRKNVVELGLEITPIVMSKENSSSENPIIIGSKAYNKKVLDEAHLSGVLRDTLNSVIKLGGRASADGVSELTHRQSNLESSYLRELWSKGLLLTRERDGRVVFYSTPERVFCDLLKKHGNLTVVQLKSMIQDYVFDHRIEGAVMHSLIESARIKNLITFEGDVLSLAEAKV